MEKKKDFTGLFNEGTKKSLVSISLKEAGIKGLNYKEIRELPWNNYNSCPSDALKELELNNMAYRDNIGRWFWKEKESIKIEEIKENSITEIPERKEHIYLVVEDGQRCKIGKTTNLDTREKNYKTHNQYFDSIWEVDDCDKIEKILLDVLEGWRMDRYIGDEWHRIDSRLAKKICNSIINLYEKGITDKDIDDILFLYDKGLSKKLTKFTGE